MQKTLAFVDETGNSDLETSKAGVSKYYILAAILIDADNLDKLSDGVEQLRSRHFQTGEIKSSKIGNNHQRRIKILKDFIDLDFHFYFLAVEKDALIKDSGCNSKGHLLNM